MTINEVYEGLKRNIAEGVYFSVKLEVNRFSSAGEEIEYGIYVEDMGHVRGCSWAEVYFLALNMYGCRPPVQPTADRLGKSVKGLELIGGDKR